MPVDELLNTLSQSGFSVTASGAKSTFKDKAVIEMLTRSKSAVGELLLSFPDYFIILPKMTQGMFFLKVSASLALKDNEAVCYAKYYPDDVLLVRDLTSIDTEARWLKGKRNNSVRRCIEERFKVKLTRV